MRSQGKFPGGIDVNNWTWRNDDFTQKWGASNARFAGMYGARANEMSPSFGKLLKEHMALSAETLAYRAKVQSADWVDRLGGAWDDFKTKLFGKLHIGRQTSDRPAEALINTPAAQTAPGATMVSGQPGAVGGAGLIPQSGIPGVTTVIPGAPGSTVIPVAPQPHQPYISAPYHN